MAAENLRQYLNQLLAENSRFDPEMVATFKRKVQDWGGISREEWDFLVGNVLREHRDRFDSEATRQDFERFLIIDLKAKSSPLERLFEIAAGIPGNLTILIEAFRGQIGQVFEAGTASPEDVKKVREAGSKLNVRGTASIAKIEPQAGVAEVEAALRRTIEEISGFDFLSSPPQGKGRNEHTILIKVGVNWGHFLYPTVTSWESVYAVTRMCFDRARDSGAAIRVIVGDESGIETKLWAGTTMRNFEHTGILHAAVLAGLEQAVLREAAEPRRFRGARDLLGLVRSGHRVTLDREDAESRKMVAMARQAGVEIIGFDEVEYHRIPVPGAKHFQDEILVPQIVADEVTDIINLPKPPGRHLIMGNTGLTGALKNHIGLLAGSDRAPALHGPFDRFPAINEGQDGDSYVDSLKALKKAIAADKGGEVARRFAHSIHFDWEADGPGISFHEKVVEIYLAFADKERFSACDMRRTVSSIGPDLGDTMDIGTVIAAKDPMTLDAFAGAFLKRAYVEIGSAIDALKPGGDTFLEYLAGKSWLRRGTPFDLLTHIAANSYGVGPIDLDHIDLRGVERSGFSEREMEALIWYLEGQQ
jgi:uncharacterized protein (DUF362 family)